MSSFSLNQLQDEYDVLIIGGGPSGATAGLLLSREGVSVLIVEKNKFPRFHVGESFLPRNHVLLEDIGLGPALRRLPHIPKYGAEFGFGNELETYKLLFDECLEGETQATFNVARADFDSMLLNAACEAGTTVAEGVKVGRIVRLEDGDAVIEVEGRTVSGKCLIDASGQSSVVARHLKTRKPVPGHTKVAYVGHFENVKRLKGREEGHPTIAMCDEGWFWIIPIDQRRTSIGMVIDVEATRRVGLPANEMLAWGIAHCPLMADRTAAAVFPERTSSIADFSYRCSPYAGPGYFLVGDSALFVDPIFSTGVCMGMMAAQYVTTKITQVLRGTLSPQRARRDYIKFVDGSSPYFLKLVEFYYRHSFRELFITDPAPWKLKETVISILAGHVFPRPSAELRWRFKLFELVVWLQKYYPMAPRKRGFSLLQAAGVRSHRAAPTCQ
jgi:flavin-dependent dehydrogenase